MSKFLEKYVPNNEFYWKLFRNGKIDKQTLRYKRLKVIFDKLNYEISDSLIDDISDDYIQMLPENNHLFNGAVEILEKLKQIYSLHIITNGFKDVQFFKLRNSGLISFFDTITDSSSVGKKKPHPDIFNFALSSAGVKAHESIMIGDSLEADVSGELSVGMSAIHFQPLKIINSDKYVEINELSELNFLV